MINGLVEQWSAITAEITKLVSSGVPLYTTDPVSGDVTFSPEGLRYNSLLQQQAALEASLEAAGYDVAGEKSDAGGVSPNTAATLKQRQAEAAQQAKQFGATLEQRQAEAEQDALEANMDAVIDMLDAEIARGNLGIAEAATKARAAADRAGVETDLLKAFAGQNLPPGTEVFPNLGTEGPVGQAAASLGFPFADFETGGTFEISPSKIASPITSAVSGLDVVSRTDRALAAAAQSLESLGVPIDGRPSRAQTGAV